MEKQKTVLVTGAAGFIGSHLCRRLLKEGYQVIGLDNLNLSYSPRLKLSHLEDLLPHKNFKFILGDITKKDFLDKMFKERRIDIIAHLAARAGVRDSIKKPLWFKEANISGTVNLLELAKQYHIQNFIFASSSSVYGEREEVPFKEEQNTDKPISPYSASKKACELFCYTYSYLLNIPITVLRYFNVYGPDMRPELAMPLFLDKLQKGLPIPQYGDGSMLRNYTYIDDIIEGTLKAIQQPRQYIILNLGGNEVVSLNDLIKTLENITGRRAVKNILPKPAGDVSVTYADSSKAKKYLNWSPRTSFMEGCRKFVDSYRRQRLKRLQKIFLPGITKRVLIFSLNYVPYMSGAEISVKEITNRIDHYYYDLICARFDKRLPVEEKIGQLNVYRVGWGNDWDKFFYPFLALLKAWQLKLKNSYDIVWGLMASYAGLAAMLFNLFNPRTKYLLSLHKGEGKRYFFRYTWFWRPFYRLIYRRADVIHATSSFHVARAKKYGYRGEVKIIPNGVINVQAGQYSLNELEKLKHHVGFGENDIILAVKTSLFKGDAIPDAMQALFYLPKNYKLMLMAPASAKSNFLNMAKLSGISERVKFVPFVKNFDLIKYFKISHVFLKLARNERLGTSVLEAMLCHLPVVGSDVKGINDLIVHGQTGLLCRPGDSQDIADKTKTIVENQILKKEITDRAFAAVTREYDWETVAEKIKEIFENI